MLRIEQAVEGEIVAVAHRLAEVHVGAVVGVGWWRVCKRRWVPAFAGTTVRGRRWVPAFAGTTGGSHLRSPPRGSGIRGAATPRSPTHRAGFRPHPTHRHAGRTTA